MSEGAVVPSVPVVAEAHEVDTYRESALLSRTFERIQDVELYCYARLRCYSSANSLC